MMDFSKCLYDPTKGKVADKMREDMPEFDESLEDMERFRTQICRYIVMMYDVESPLRKIYPDINHRRREAALLAGFELNPSKEIPKKVLSILVGENPVTTNMIMAYLMRIGIPELVSLEATQAMFEEVTKRMVSKQAEKEDMEQHRKLLKDIKSLEEEVFRGKEAADIKRALYKGMETARKAWKPEDVAKKKRLNPQDTLEEGNPYSRGIGYMIEPMKFLGDEEPLGMESTAGEDRWVVLNDNDPHLRAIYLSLPKAPPLNRIDGHDKPIEDQRFERIQPPSRLRALEEDVMRELKRREVIERDFRINGYTMYKTFWDKLDTYYEEYQEEIQWLKRVWWHRINGYWFMNRGKPTYITGWHFTYLNYFYLGEAGQYPDYRDRDRRWYLVQKYAHECTETFMDYDRKGNAIKKDGVYRMIDKGKRLFFGVANTKGRRMGDTTKALVPYHELAVITTGGLSGIMSFGGDSSEAIFDKKFIPAWQRFPIWFRPMFSNTNKPSVIDYEPPRNVYGEEGLGTTLDVASSADQQAYDSKAVDFLLIDESGKLTRHEVNRRWATLRRCLQQGSVIKGYSIQPTTVEEMEAGGGKEFYQLMENADFYRRIVDSGMTVNGLLKVFFRSSDGRLGYIDSYGYSVEHEPTEWQIKEGFTKGCFDVLNNEREQLRRDGSTEAMAEYRECQRKDPLFYMDSFVSETGGLRFDYLKIGEAKERLQSKTKARRYDIVCDPSNPDGMRRLVPNEEGKFLVSLDLPPERTNKKVRVLDYDPIKEQDVWTWKPMDMRTFIASCDPIRYFNPGDVKRTGKKFSKVGGVVVWKRDMSLDADEDPKKWQSYRTICTYLHSPNSPDEYLEDMLNMSVYFGAPMYPEINIDSVWKYFVERGYGGYLLYDLDPMTGKRKNKPGCYVGDKSEGFSLLEFYSKFRMDSEEHLELVEEFDSIKSVQDLTNRDLLAAFMYALIGAKGGYADRVERFSTDRVDLCRLGGLF